MNYSEFKTFCNMLRKFARRNKLDLVKDTKEFLIFEDHIYYIILHKKFFLDYVKVYFVDKRTKQTTKVCRTRYARIEKFFFRVIREYKKLLIIESLKYE